MDKVTALFVLAVVLGAGAVFMYWRVAVEDTPGDYHVRKANYRLEDGEFEEAVEEFELALEQNPSHRSAHLGLGVTYIQMGRLDDAVEEFDECVELDPEYAAAYANRGIVLDRLGRHEDALSDYRAALEIDPSVADGPGWLWRFLRNIDEKPPTIKDRADYLEAELAKPPEERVLEVPEEDDKQRMYKVQ